LKTSRKTISSSSSFRKRFWWVILALCLAVGLYLIPPINRRANYYFDEIRAKIIRALAPPEKVVFVPQPANTILPHSLTPGTMSTVTPVASATLPGSTPTFTNTPAPTITASPIPPVMTLVGATHEYQKWNNCGPATLAEALTFWHWPGDQSITAAYTKPNTRDKNVGPQELVDFVLTQTNLKALMRMGGNLDLLKKLLAAGFPVIVEKGFEIPGEDWMGHYLLLTGYDDQRRKFVAQDVYIMADFPEPYDELAEYWQHFNYIYLIIYPPEREAEVLAILGPQADQTYNYQAAAQLALDEISQFTDRKQYFAWYNLGTNLVYLQDYAGAAAAYDQAFALYSKIPEDKRPWRMLWYQQGPYEAYFYTDRYTDVVTLATNTINYSVEPALEESFYWRGRARVALGLTDKAVADFRSCLKWHPGYAPALAELQALGVEP
jgi:hypothetical protein